MTRFRTFIRALADGLGGVAEESTGKVNASNISKLKKLFSNTGRQEKEAALSYFSGDLGYNELSQKTKDLVDFAQTLNESEIRSILTPPKRNITKQAKQNPISSKVPPNTTGATAAAETKAAANTATTTSQWTVPTFNEDVPKPTLSNKLGKIVQEASDEVGLRAIRNGHLTPTQKEDIYRQIDYIKEEEATKRLQENAKPTSSKISQTPKNQKSILDKIKDIITGEKYKPTKFQIQNKGLVNKLDNYKIDFSGVEDPDSRPAKIMMERLNKSKSNLREELRGAKDQQAFDEILKNHGIDMKEGYNRKDLLSSIKNHYANQVKEGPTVGDTLVGYHAPGVAAATAIGASALAAVSNSGRRTNAQLYSDPFVG